MNALKIQNRHIVKDWSPKALWVLCVTIIAGTLAFDLHLPLGIASTVPYTLAVLVAALLRSRAALVGVVLTTSALTLLGMFYSPTSPHISPWHVLFNRGLVLFSMWMVALLLDHRNTLQAKREEALTRIRILEGLLPICAECKKIRDPSNDWQPLESFITNNSHATFTHGICPDCSERAWEAYENDRSQGTRS
jgi:hypothetical protein